jgi:hypothetical protein
MVFTSRTAITLRTTRTFQLGLISLLLLVSTSCNIGPGEVSVVIDNAGPKPLVVEVDGQEAATIPAGDFRKLSYPPGEYQFRITSGGEVLCDLKRELVKSDRFGVGRKYLFNPDKNNRYQTYQARYGSSRLDGVLQNTMLSYQKDEQLKRQYIYRQLLKEIKLLPGDAWNDVSGIEYVLEEPPEFVMSRGTARRTVLARLDERSYERFKEMEKIEKPTDEDIDTLDELLDEILSQAP